MLVPELEAQAEILSLGNSKDRRVCSIDSSFSTIEEANGFILLAPERNFDSILNLIPEQDVVLDRGPASNLRFESNIGEIFGSKYKIQVLIRSSNSNKI